MLKSGDIAKELHISEGTVRAYARGGLIPFFETPGGHRRYVLEDVRAALEMAKKHSIEPLEDDDQAPRLAEQAPAAPLRRGRSRRRGITRAAIAEARAAHSETLVKELHQGDVIDVAKSVRLYSPDAPSYPSEVAGVPRDEPVMTMETRLPSGLCVIVSQDCDLRRMPGIEPYVVVAPLTEVNETTYREAADSMSTRFFAYPTIEGHEDQQNLVVDMRVVSSLEKTALMSPHIERIPCPLSGPKREDLLSFLGDRFGRKPFPDEIERQLIRPIESALKRVRKKEGFAGVFSSIAFIGLRWSPGKSYCSLMLLLDPKLRERHNVAAEDVEAVKTRLQKALNHFTRDGDYSVDANFHDVTEVQATVVLSHDEIPFEVEQLELD